MSEAQSSPLSSSRADRVSGRGEGSFRGEVGAPEAVIPSMVPKARATNDLGTQAERIHHV